jgi:hypothetical protein
MASFVSDAENFTPDLLSVLCALGGEASSEFTTKGTEFKEIAIHCRC